MIKNFKDFVNEALLPSMFRNFMPLFNRERYADIFKKYKEMYSGDRNAYRIYLPIEKKNRYNPIEEDIKDFLTENGYEIIDYFTDSCKFKSAKNPSKIGQILTKLKAVDLMKQFVEDPARKAGGKEGELLVCISRHPYDVAGADTDRDWTNCQTLALPDYHYRIQNMMDRILKLPYGGERSDLEYRMSNLQRTGSNARFLSKEVEKGSLMSYLIKNDDKNINNPLAVLNIKPYIKDGQIYLNACKRSYSATGAQNKEFMDTVRIWLEEVNKGKSGIFMLDPEVYPDDDTRILHVGDRSIKDVVAESSWLNKLSAKEILEVKELSFEGYGLTSLEGIEIYKNLKKLYIDNNKLKSLKGIESLTKLERLTFDNNNVESLKLLRNLTKLSLINCNNNRISGLEGTEHLYKLKTFVCCDNMIESLKPLENLNMITFICNNNRVKSLKDLRNNINLEKLEVIANRLSNLDGVGGLEKLTSFFCGGNKIKSLDGLGKVRPRYFSYVNNNLEEPVPVEFVNLWGNPYNDKDRERMGTYEFQKKFLKTNPKRAADLLYIGINDKIKEEFQNLF